MSHEKWRWQTKRSIPSEAAAGREIIDEVLSQLRVLTWVEHDIFAIHLALDEALVNAIKHGNRHDPLKQVHFRCQISERNVLIEIADEGPGFDPHRVPDCTLDENLEVPSGRGLMLMRSFMSRVEYNDQGNCVIMEKWRDSNSSS